MSGAQDGLVATWWARTAAETRSGARQSGTGAKKVACTKSARIRSGRGQNVRLGVSGGGHRGVFSKILSSTREASKCPKSGQRDRAISAALERARRLTAEAGGPARGSEPASGAMPAQNEPELGPPSRPQYMLGPPARRKTRSEKAPESDFGQPGTPPAAPATTTCPGSRRGLMPCEWSPRWARGDLVCPYGR